MLTFCADITATQAALLLGLNRNTINRYYGLFRDAIFSDQEEQRGKFFGTVEVDESYFGATRPRGASKKLNQPVFGVFQRGGRVYTEIVPDA